ncbi:MAG: hypothetical protein MJ175_01920 [Clostridia bacterium]|nr:hypothetical protein [Clostridia bacterium]
MQYSMRANSGFGLCEVSKESVRLIPDRNAVEAFFSAEISFSDWEENAYILIPACAYNGNRLTRVVRGYPPMYRPEEAGADCDPLMTEVPALNPDGSGSIQVTTGDMATPCVGIFYREKKEAFFLFTAQQVGGRNIGYTVEAGKITLSMPANRTDLYRFCRPHEKSGDRGIPVVSGETIETPYRILTFPCGDMAEFYRIFFANRKCLLSSPRAAFAYTDELWALMETHFNTANWSGNYIAEGSHVWQAGWVGGGMSSYLLLKSGNALSTKRAIATIGYMTARQGDSGFYRAMYKPTGEHDDDSFSTPGMEGLHMTRKSADALYFLFKHLNIESFDAPEYWRESARRCADAFVTLFARYGTFGQFVNEDSGDMIVGTSASATMAPAALARAYEYFGDKKYLDTAERSLQFYRDNYLANGITNGGPGEILSAPDSESAFALLESCAVLYEVTKKLEYLVMAEEAACFASSWVVSYSYRFPENSEFGRRHVNTVGTVFANVQNKHSAPGICTLSGDSLYKLWKWTGKREYLELIKDISYAIPQCVSTDDAPIYSWDEKPELLPPGYICERVNMSDWEGFDCVGGVFNGTCWCETSLILSNFELMCYDEMREEA